MYGTINIKYTYNPSLTADMRQSFDLVYGNDVENHKPELDCLEK